MNFPGFYSWRVWLRSTLLFLAVALPVAFYLRTYDSSMAKVTLLQLGILAASAAYLLGSLGQGRFEVPAESLGALAPATLLLSWNALRFAFAAHRLASLQGFIQQEAFLLTFLLTAVAFSRRDLRLAAAAVLGGWLIVVLYGAAQRCGLDPFIWKGAFGEQVFSTASNPGFLAAYLVLCAPLSVIAATDEGLPSWRLWVLAAGAVLGSLVLAWTGSRLGIELFAVVAVLFLFLSRRFLPGRMAAPALALALAGLCLAAGLVFSVSGSAERRRDLYEGKAFKIETWKGTWAMIAERPWLGRGPGSFWVEYPAFRRPRVILLEHRLATETDHAESRLLEQWTEGGIVGAGLWLWLFGAVLAAGWKALREPGPAAPEAGYGVALLTAVLGGVLAAQVSSTDCYVVSAWPLYFEAGLLAAFARCRSIEEGAVLALPLPGGAARLACSVAVLAGASWLAWSSARLFRSDIHHNFAVYWSKQKEWDQALAEYDQEVPGASNYVMSRYFIGNVLSDSGDPERALARYRQARALAPNYVEIHFMEASALLKLGREKEAIERLEAQTRLNPVWGEPWRLLAGLYRETGRPEKADFAARQAAAAKAAWENPGSASF